jgi:alginate O-acetyltransferase complex protein AlgI
MLFNSDAYLIFLPTVVVLTWALPARFRPLFLLVASYFFYAYWNASFLLLIIGLTAVNYVIGLLQGASLPRRRSWLLLALAADLGALAIFKYLGLMEQSAVRLASILGLPADLPALRLVLPLGLSFFTFEFIHYQVDLYRGDKPVRDPVRFALFPAFFPTQIAGPIKRYQDFDRQVASPPRFSAVLAVDGLQLIGRGLFKKAIADTLAPTVAVVFAAPAGAHLIDAWVALIAFGLQIYLDFSGYTDIGRGSAQLLGYTVPENFRSPYLATSARDFWRRWHMSLSSWLRDYLYIPLGGSRHGATRTQLNLMVTMALGGLWHGAAWHFVVWGAGHGVALAVNREWQERATRGLGRIAIPALAAWAAIQLTVLLLWSLFRVASLEQGLTLWTRLIAGGPGNAFVHRADLAWVGLVLVGLFGAQLLLPRLRWNIGRAEHVLRPAYITALVLAAVYLATNATQRFIYFQF